MLHQAYQRDLFLYSNAEQFTEGSLHLSDMQFGLFDIKDTDENGLAPVIDVMSVLKNDKRYVIKQGRSPRTQTRSHEDKNFSTQVFSINDIVEVGASYPKSDKMLLDEWVVGYDGHPENAIRARKGDRIRFELEMRGRLVELLGYEGGCVSIEDTLMVPMDPQVLDLCEEYDPCEEVDLYPLVERMVKRMRNQPLVGNRKVEDLVEITPVYELNGDKGAPRPNTQRKLTGWCLEVCDAGGPIALAKVQGQYPGHKVIRKDQTGGVSKYYMMPLTNFKPDDYVLKVDAVLADCGECGGEFSKIEGGYVYTVRLADEGKNMSVEIADVLDAMVGTTHKLQGQAFSIGTYVTVLEKKLTKAAISEFVEAHPTAEVSFVIKTEDICANEDVAKVEWQDCGECTISYQVYQITIADDHCGNDILEKLQEMYPQLGVALFPGSSAGCQHTYEGTVVTNMICSEPCDEIYRDFYSSERPKGYGLSEWKLVDKYKENHNTLVGIRFVGRASEFMPNIWTIDELNGFEDAVRISVRAGYPDEIREGISIYDDPLNVTQLSMYTPLTHMGYKLLPMERASHVYFTGRPIHGGNNITKEILGTHSRIELDRQYADIWLTIRPHTMGNMPGQFDVTYTKVHFHVPFGGHAGVVEFVNKLAAAAKVDGIAE